MDCVLEAPDFEVIRGNNFPPLKWQFLTSENPDVLTPLDGSVFKLMIAWPNGLTIAKSSDTDAELAVDEATSIVAWTYSTDESRSLPLGRIAGYELERWSNGTQQTLIRGKLAVSDGLNPDEHSFLVDGSGNQLVDELGNNIIL